MITLEQTILDNEYMALPEEVIDREGMRVDIRGDIWSLNGGSQSRDTINIGRYRSSFLRYAVSRYLITRIEKVSPVECTNVHNDIVSCLIESGFLASDEEPIPFDDFQNSLIATLHNSLRRFRSQNKIHRFYRVARWYIWCADHIPELGFCTETALEFSRIKIPGNQKGQAVRNQDPEEGPLHFGLEEPLVRRALRQDNHMGFAQQQERLAVALCLAFGRNPLNFTQLLETDLVNITADYPDVEDVWVLYIPRIKKRGSIRGLFKEEACDGELVEMIVDLIRQNQEVETYVGDEAVQRPLFNRGSPDLSKVNTDSYTWAYHIDTAEFRLLIKSWVERVGLVSPLTGELLNLTPRRLRYTFACNMARQGASKAALAEMLDHSDTQHVHVYYEMFDELVGMLDKALVEKIGPLLGWFQGTVINDASDAVNGDNSSKHLFFVNEEDPTDQDEIGVCGELSLCQLDPPYSCYLCPKFQPYRNADHDRVLELLIERREKILAEAERNRIAVQLDDIIYAVGEVAAACRGA